MGRLPHGLPCHPAPRSPLHAPAAPRATRRPPQGLIPRASELVKLGGGIFLAFLPFIAAISLLWGLIYVSPLGGERLVHGGDRNSGPPAYISPEQLLSEPTVDP